MKKLRLIVRNFLMTSFIAVAGTASAQTWSTQTSGITDNVNDIYFIDDESGYAVADGGRILETLDGGKTWTLLNSGVSTDLTGVYFFNSSFGFAVGDNGVIRATIDGGNNWSAGTSGTTEDLSDIYFVSINEGYIVGASGTVLRTTDGGMNWNGQTSNTTQDLNDVHFANGTTGMAVGDGVLNGTIIATFNSGANWSTQTSGTLNNLNGVFLVDGSTAYAVGDLGTIVKTTNGGSNWNTLTSGTVSNLNSVYFTNDSVGYVVGAAGTILKTSNGGTTWTPLTSGTTSALNSVSIRQEYFGYAGGNSGQIVRTCPYVDFTMTPNDTVCMGDMIMFSNNSISANSYTWVVDGDTLATTKQFSHTFDSVGNYVVTLYADNGTCTGSESVFIYVDRMDEIFLGNDTSICSTCSITLDAGPGATQYIWYKNNVPTGDSTQTLNVNQPGTYKVEASNLYGCSAEDVIAVSFLTSVKTVGTANGMVTYPNPNNGHFNLGFEIEEAGDVSIRVINYLGDVVYVNNLKNFSGKYSQEMNLGGYAAGTYMVQVIHNNTISTATVVTFK